jgi:hypothetical protein
MLLFASALAPTSIQQVYLACKIIAPFIYRINSKPELSVEIIIELYKSLASVLNQSTAGYAHLPFLLLPPQSLHIGRDQHPHNLFSTSKTNEERGHSAKGCRSTCWTP